MVKRLLLAGAFAATGAGVASTAPAPPEYRFAKSVALERPDHWDFLRFDPAQDRVFVAHQSEITIVGRRSGTLLARSA